MKHRDKISSNDLPILDDGMAFPRKVDWQKWEKEHAQKLHILQPKIVEKKKIPTVCLDTNVVIALTVLWSADKGNACQIPPRDSTFKGIRQLQKLIEEDKIIAIVTPYVMEELYFGIKRFGDGFLNYMKQNNVCALDIPKEKDVYYFEDVENTALRYCGRCKSPYAPHPIEGRNRENQVFQLEFKQHIKRPNIDARIMAEASLLGCPLLTHNIHHFMDNGKAEDITRINKEINLGDGLRPYRPADFEFMLEANNEFPKLCGRYKNYVKPAKEVEL